MTGALRPLAEVAALSDWIGDAIPEGTPDHTRAAAALRIASHTVRSHVGRTWAEGEAVPGDVADVTLAVAGRVYLNPDGWGNVRLDDFGAGQRPVEEWGAYLTASEKRILDDYRPRKVSGLGVLSTHREPLREHGSGLVPTPDGPPFPWW